MSLKIILVVIQLVVATFSYAQGPPPQPPPPTASPASILTTYDERSLRRGEYAFTRNLVESKLASTLMRREMPYRVILPSDYERWPDARYPVVYLLHGLTGNYTNWTDQTMVGKGAHPAKFIIVTPEGNDGWYTDSVTKPDDKFESYIVKELIPEIDKKFRTMPSREQRAIAGLSMGGYGALKFGLKYPDVFSLAGSFSGAVSAAAITEKSFPGAIGKTIDAIFGVAASDTRRANDLFEIVRRITPETRKTMAFLYLDCGTEDFLFQSNRDFVSLLLEKDVPHEYRQLPGTHNWKYWNIQVEEFIRLAADRFETARKKAQP